MPDPMARCACPMQWHILHSCAGSPLRWLHLPLVAGARVAEQSSYLGHPTLAAQCYTADYAACRCNREPKQDSAIQRPCAISFSRRLAAWVYICVSILRTAAIGNTAEDAAGGAAADCSCTQSIEVDGGDGQGVLRLQGGHRPLAAQAGRTPLQDAPLAAALGGLHRKRRPAVAAAAAAATALSWRPVAAAIAAGNHRMTQREPVLRSKGTTSTAGQA